MNKKFAYLDTETCQYVFADSIEQLLDGLAKTAVRAYMKSYSHEALYSVVEVQDDGTEKWFSPSGEGILSPEEVAASVKPLIPVILTTTL